MKDYDTETTEVVAEAMAAAENKLKEFTVIKDLPGDDPRRGPQNCYDDYIFDAVIFLKHLGERGYIVLSEGEYEFVSDPRNYEERD